MAMTPNDETKAKAVNPLSVNERNRHLKRHIEMERLFGAEFLPISKSALRAEPDPTKKASEKGAS